MLNDSTNKITASTRQTRATQNSPTSSPPLPTQTTPTPRNHSRSINRSNSINTQNSRTINRSNSIDSAARPAREVLTQLQQQPDQNLLNRRKNKLQELLNLAKQGRFQATLF